MSVAEKILNVIESVGAVGKDKNNSYQGYQYTSAEAFLAAIRAPMVQHGLICLPSQVGIEIEEGVYICRYEFTLIDANDPSNQMTLPWVHTIPVMAKGKSGEYIDDKAMGKSQTYAHRYFLMKLFLITDKESDIDGNDSASQYAVGSDTAQNQSEPTPQSRPNGGNISNDLWTTLYQDDEILARYNQNRHHIAKAVNNKYQGDPIKDGFAVVKKWLLSRETSAVAS